MAASLYRVATLAAALVRCQALGSWARIGGFGMFIGLGGDTRAAGFKLVSQRKDICC